MSVQLDDDTIDHPVPEIPTVRLLLTTLALVVVAAGCASGETTAVDEAAGVRVVSVDDAATLLDQADTPTLIDVRTPGEFAQGHLEGAVLVDYNSPDFRERIAEFDRDESYVIYCRSGNRSAGARDIMTELGFTDVADIDGGIASWVSQGQPIVTG